jgi:acyl dehydratase
LNTRVQSDFEGFFEDFVPGVTYRHARGRTVTEFDNVLITHMVLNTAEPHFNEHFAQKDPMFRTRVVFGGITVAMVIGLAAQDTARHAIREVGMTAIRLHAPVHHGDTLYAFSSVLETLAQGEAGLVSFRHRGLNQDDTLVFSGERQVLIRRRNTK